MKDLVNAPNRFLGVDVQQRSCPYVLIDDVGCALDAGWLVGATPAELAAALRSVVEHHESESRTRLALGIDAPRLPLPARREWYWTGVGSKPGWRRRRPSESGLGRHCEVVIAAHRLANPQWTPYKPPFPGWMQVGFSLFAEIAAGFSTHEVFPSASYALLSGDPSLRVDVRLGDFAQGPKDVLDAYVAAATVREFTQGRGCAVGGGDGLGQIILPRPIPELIHEVMKWPTA